MRRQPLKLRIGIHSGPAVAGVIGRNRLSMICGRHRERAARIEHAATPHEIYQPDATRERLGAGFTWTAMVMSKHAERAA